jgi:hypothetical protein
LGATGGAGLGINAGAGLSTVGLLEEGFVVTGGFDLTPGLGGGRGGPGLDGVEIILSVNISAGGGGGSGSESESSSE